MNTTKELMIYLLLMNCAYAGIILMILTVILPQLPTARDFWLAWNVGIPLIAIGAIAGMAMEYRFNVLKIGETKCN